mmetsp:Transcript_72132/g.145097  ORF Transcript_72132/g.145097 Transcript_72132/m.145097 type:complete len:310 (+) Transcript_72132:30-959(+)
MHVIGASLRMLSTRLVSLSSACGWTHYGMREWNYLFASGCDDGWVIEEREGEPGTAPPLLGSLLRVRYAGAEGGAGAIALGMMLVDPKSRGQGLGKRLMLEALEASEGETIILGAATDLGQPMYAKMGYVSMGSVSFLSLPPGSSLGVLDCGGSSIIISSAEGLRVDSHERSVLLQYDALVTGLDRSRALDATIALQGSMLALALDRVTREPIGAALMVLGADGGGPWTIGPVVGAKIAAVPLVHGLASAAGAAAAGVNLKVSNQPELIAALESFGFTVNAALCDMTYEGRPMPGQRELYHALLHPTLG